MKKEPILILSSSQLRCLISSNRVAVLRAMRFADEVAVKDVAAALKTTPEALHHHFRALVREGLIREVSERRAGKRFEKLYSLSARRYFMDTKSRNPEFRALVEKAFRRYFSQTESDILCAYGEALDESDIEDLLTLQRFTIRVSAEDAREIKQRMDELLEFALSKDSEEGQPFSGLVALTPQIQDPLLR